MHLSISTSIIFILIGMRVKVRLPLLLSSLCNFSTSLPMVLFIAFFVMDAEYFTVWICHHF